MTLLGFGDCDCERAGAGTSAGEILACGAVIHNLPPPCCAEPLRSVMNNCDTDISGDCPVRHSPVFRRSVFYYIGTTSDPATGLIFTKPQNSSRAARVA